MENKALPMPVVIGIIVAVVLVIGFFGWNATQRPPHRQRRGPFRFRHSSHPMPTLEQAQVM